MRLRPALRPLPLLLAALLAACATPPVNPPRPSAHAETSTRSPSPAAAPVLPTLPAAAADEADLWNALRASFAMDDCDADPSILAWAKRYTRNPAGFEAQMDEALPRLAYVQRIASEHGVAGEFVLLPWVESGFQPAPRHRRENRPAGMWQIMPVTARHLGLRVGDDYDGRLDIPNATEAVMTLLQDYHGQFRDWRVTDYAYNGGESAMRQMVARYDLPPKNPAIPRWPVPAVTRQHLVKLLALACIVREPERFGIDLPRMAPERQLRTVRIDRPTTLAKAAGQAGMPLENLRRLNPGYLDDTSRDGVLLMPRDPAAQWLEAAAGASADTDATTTAALPSASAGIPYLDGAADATDADARQSPPDERRAVHVVKPGETLSQIARRYDVSAKDIRRWNHLDGNRIKPGQKLRIRAGG